MKSTLRVLGLVLALVWTKAQESCHQTLGPQELHKVEGDWVAVWGVMDGTRSSLIPNITSSHLQIKLLDNKTLNYIERNTHITSECSNYIINATVPDSSNEEEKSLVSLGGTVEWKGKITTYHDNSTIDFLHVKCDHCMKMVYNSPHWGRFLLMYRKEGHHRDVEELKQKHKHFEKHAECMGFPLDTVFVYDGKTDFCHKKSAPEDECEEHKKTLHPHHLPKVEGEWVLVWGVSDGPKGKEMLLNVTSSNLELKLLDNKTLNYNERNVYQKSNSVNFVVNFTVPDSSDGEKSLVFLGGTMEKEGKIDQFHDNATLDLLHVNCDHCMKLVYNSPDYGRYLLVYMKKGHHSDVKQLKQKHEGFNKQAECLGFGLDSEHRR